MDKTQINRILIKTARFSGYVLALLMMLYFISGYGMTKGIMDPVLAEKLHDKWLPIPFIIFFILHVFIYLKFTLRRWLKDEKWTNIYVIILSLVILIFLFYLYFL